MTLKNISKPKSFFGFFVSEIFPSYGGAGGQGGVILKSLSVLGGDRFLADGMAVWGRFLGWLRDPKFLNASEMASPKPRDSAIAWRSHVACWAAHQAVHVDGDFYEFGCYEGFTGALIRSFLGDSFCLNTYGRKYFWFDRFSGSGSQKKLLLDQKNSFSNASSRAALYDDIEIFSGDIIDTFVEDKSSSFAKIAFAHFDLNDFEVEIRVLECVMPRMSKGGVILFDDYSMVPFYKQNIAYRQILRAKGIEILELPTGQGVAIF